MSHRSNESNSLHAKRVASREVGTKKRRAIKPVKIQKARMQLAKKPKPEAEPAKTVMAAVPGKFGSLMSALKEAYESKRENVRGVVNWKAELGEACNGRVVVGASIVIDFDVMPGRHEVKAIHFDKKRHPRPCAGGQCELCMSDDDAISALHKEVRLSVRRRDISGEQYRHLDLTENAAAQLFEIAAGRDVDLLFQGHYLRFSAKYTQLPNTKNGTFNQWDFSGMRFIKKNDPGYAPPIKFNVPNTELPALPPSIGKAGNDAVRGVNEQHKASSPSIPNVLDVISAAKHVLIPASAVAPTVAQGSPDGHVLDHPGWLIYRSQNESVCGSFWDGKTIHLDIASNNYDFDYTLRANGKPSSKGKTDPFDSLTKTCSQSTFHEMWNDLPNENGVDQNIWAADDGILMLHLEVAAHVAAAQPDMLKWLKHAVDPNWCRVKMPLGLDHASSFMKNNGSHWLMKKTPSLTCGADGRDTETDWNKIGKHLEGIFESRQILLKKGPIRIHIR